MFPDDEEEERDLYEQACHVVNGTLIDVEGDGIFTYRCPTCSQEHRAKVLLTVLSMPPHKKTHRDVSPEVGETKQTPVDDRVFSAILESESVRTFLEER